jgi:F-type H+-transporting ATPase subunit delta
MASANMIARPYAKAAFEYATEQRSIESWAQALEQLANLFANDEMRALLQHPKFGQQELIEILLNTKLVELDQHIKNFMRLLAEQSRLGCLSAINEAYKHYVAESQKVCQAVLISTIAVDAAYIEKIKLALSKKFNQTVELETKIDESLLGGAVIKAGDLVIDGSVRGQLNRLAQELTK